MFNKDEITAVLNILTRSGLKIDVSEARGFALLTQRFESELGRLAVDSSNIRDCQDNSQQAGNRKNPSEPINDSNISKLKTK